MVDIAGLELTAEDADVLTHPLVGGLILFSRNYSETEQLRSLVESIRAITPSILIAVDQEGGRVQRFKDGFTRIPAMGQLLQLAKITGSNATELAFACGLVIGYELRQFDIDISFAPVLDLDNISDVIGDRAFSGSITEVCQMGSAFVDGFRAVGMKSTGKHFPGHGSVKADSHIAAAIDHRDLPAIEQADMQVFSQLIAANKIDALMPAHVIFPQVDQHPAGFSTFWLQRVLRDKLGFDGVIFSDDLSMQAATVTGDAVARTKAALSAGCDMALVCNDRAAVLEVLAKLPIDFKQSSRIQQLKPHIEIALAAVTAEYEQAKAQISQVLGAEQ
ncbi:beta-N-acetylhexosaminidase [Alteromonas sp. ASW11-36]|uniref:Beta-hexosaminidase n=2 Tax=Alteromonas arenosi TaxID=3055817 RepID=A0ABT7SY63_9ALTE|nr:beta-N-acetylhexosaminidase [Alteromonas sp. ASW11-36]